MDFCQNFITGLQAAVITKTFIYPFQRARTHMNYLIRVGFLDKPLGMMKYFTTSIMGQGFFSIYKYFLPNAIPYILNQAFALSVYQKLQSISRQTKGYEWLNNYYASGAVTGIIWRAFTYPVTLHVFFQDNSFRKPPSSFEKKLKMSLTGYDIKVFINCFCSSIYFCLKLGLYHSLSNYFKNTSFDIFLVNLFFGWVSSITANLSLKVTEQIPLLKNKQRDLLSKFKQFFKNDKLYFYETKFSGLMVRSVLNGCMIPLFYKLKELKKPTNQQKINILQAKYSNWLQ